MPGFLFVFYPAIISLMTETLYRKYRPETFEDVVGHESVVESLRNALKKEEPPHAFLLVGPRGIGKTTIARLIAKGLGVSSSDTYEMDGASNRKIDDIRDIVSHVNVLPLDSKFKVYIIDEAHMLTREAWPALLKTLEEPPKHVVFILATTDVEKVPDTIISRCQRYTLMMPTREEIKNHIAEVAKKEGRKMSDEALELIGVSAGGSYRDALSILQQVFAFSTEKEIKGEDVALVAGIPSESEAIKFIESAISGEISEGMKIISRLEKESRSPQVFSKILLDLGRALVVISFCKGEDALIDGFVSVEGKKELESIVKNHKRQISSKLLLKLIELARRASLEGAGYPAFALFLIEMGE